MKLVSCQPSDTYNFEVTPGFFGKCCILDINPLNAELNPICHLLALLGAHHILHVSRIRVNILCIPRAKARFKKKKTSLAVILKVTLIGVSKGKGHPCTGTEALYRPYGP